MTGNESDIDSNIFEKLFKVTDVSSIGNTWRTAAIFSKEERFISDELIYKAMTKHNMELFGIICQRWVYKAQSPKKFV